MNSILNAPIFVPPDRPLRPPGPRGGPSRCLLGGISLAIAAAGLNPTARATVLTFDRERAFAAGEPLHQAYGDKVSETPERHFGFIYGTNGGWTPNVSVSYSWNNQVRASGCGDLWGVLCGRGPGAPLVVRLRADQGFRVALEGFDVAVAGGKDASIRSVKVADEDGQTLFETNNAIVSGSGRISFRFAKGLSGQGLNLEVEVHHEAGAAAGMDNIHFSQAEWRPPVQASFYLSPGGADANPGTLDRPWRTMEKARDELRALTGRMRGDLVVFLRGGTYELARTLELSPQDSGGNGFSVVYRNYPGEIPILSGGRRVSGWRRDWRWGGKHRTSSQGITGTRQLYVDGQRRARARGRPPEPMTQTPEGYAGAKAMAGWRNPGDIEFVYTGLAGAWAEPRASIESIETSGRIRMKQPVWRSLTARSPHVGPRLEGPPTQVENALELLDEGGEWYLDRGAGALYYAPQRGEDLEKAVVIAPVLETLVSGIGTPANPVRNIQFHGIQFSYATWLRPGGPVGFAELQANVCLEAPNQGAADYEPDGTWPYGAWALTPANVTFSFAHGLRFERCRFSHLGAAGLGLGRGCRFNEVVGCVFTDISGTAVQLGDVVDPNPKDERVIPVGNQVRNCRIYDVACEYHGGVGIWGGYVQETRIEHNQIDSVPYSGICLGWGGSYHWTVATNISRCNQVRNNLVANHMRVLADGGGIYTSGPQGSSMADGCAILGNIVRNQQHGFCALYSDSGTRFAWLRGNALYDNDCADMVADWAGTTEGVPFPMGDLDFQRNFHQKPVSQWAGGPPTTGQLTVAGNEEFNDESELPAELVDAAGIEAPFKDVLK